MSDVHLASVRALAFGDLETGVWGAALLSPAGTAASFADTVELDGAGAGQEWLLAAAGVELRFAPSSEAAPFGPDVGLEAFAQVCDVQGAVRRSGAEEDVACSGIRCELLVPAVEFDSIRTATGWFGPDLGFALLALRPQRANGHEADVLACAFVEDGAPIELDEPRLSTTYTDSGLPLRAGLELWPVEKERAEQDGDADDEAGDEDADERVRYFPRRVAGESERDASRLDLPGATIRADLFRWRTRGRQGAGVYALSPAP